MKWLVLINPLVYVSEGMQAALTPGVPHMPVSLILAAPSADRAFHVDGAESVRQTAMS
jgi:hypothetical protein